MNSTTSISMNNFLDAIDPDNKIDRKRSISDISFVSLLTSFKKVSAFLEKDKQDKVKKLLSEINESSVKDIYEIFVSSGKIEDLIKISEQVAYEVKGDYIKTQLVALPRYKRELIFTKFPALKTLFEE